MNDNTEQRNLFAIVECDYQSTCNLLAKLISDYEYALYSVVKEERAFYRLKLMQLRQMEQLLKNYYISALPNLDADELLYNLRQIERRIYGGGFNPHFERGTIGVFSTSISYKSYI